MLTEQRVTQYGSYKTTHELCTRGYTSTFLAERAAGDGPDLAVVKLLQLTGGPVEPENPEGLVVEFLDSARAQQRAANASPCFAKVYQTGLLPAGGAFFVMEYFPRSLQRLLDMHARFDAGQLFGLMSQALAGLADLWRISERPHGNIKPSNVLLRDKRRPGAARSLALADPLPAACLTPEHAEDDLESLGRILYQLVTRSPSAGHVAWPVDDSPEWAELGRSGPRLRGLCNLLLDADKRPDLKLQEAQRQLTGRLRSRTAVRAMLAVAAMTLLAAPVLGYVWKHPNALASLGLLRHPASSTQPRATQPSVTPRPQDPDTILPEPRIDILRGLMNADNHDPSFKVKFAADIYRSELGNGDCIALTITPDTDCFVLVLCQDSAGKVSLLLPNGRSPRSPRVWKGQAAQVHSMGSFELPVEAPYGRTRFRVIATTRRVELVGAAPNAVTNFLEGIDALAVEPAPAAPSPRPAQTLPHLLKSDEWATAVAELVTHPPDWRFP